MVEITNADPRSFDSQVFRWPFVKNMGIETNLTHCRCLDLSQINVREV